ncbi:MAG: Rare lipoprotein precursor [Proteobacteria bacterium]|nr:Rare lipoprotein precursor [Pseudomonadota bacterium]
MRLSNRKIAAGLAAVGLTTTLSGCGLFAPDDVAYELPAAPVAPAAPGKPVKAAAAAPVANGPAADYPIVIGDPYVVNGVTYTPSDVWNYDEVGYLAMDRAGGNTISGSHHTLPVPSYVEVTSLDTGKTILVRLERRGPMNGSAVIALSPGAIAQLGASPTTPVRVRRVNPQEPERAALRSGQRAPDRMETPMSLVNVLKLKLPAGGGPAPVAVAAAPGSGRRARFRRARGPGRRVFDQGPRRPRRAGDRG